jgi:hypothetical protein
MIYRYENEGWEHIHTCSNNGEWFHHNNRTQRGGQAVLAGRDGNIASSTKVKPIGMFFGCGDIRLFGSTIIKAIPEETRL